VEKFVKQRKKIFVDGYGLSELRDYMESKGIYMVVAQVLWF